MYVRRSGLIEVLLVHPGGPFWQRKDEGAWSIPKGEPDEGEDLLAAAVREFREEMGGGAGVVAVGVFGTFLLRRIGLTVLLQLPNSYPCIRIHRAERQFDLFVSVKGNVDAVQSRAASA